MDTIRRACIWGYEPHEIVSMYPYATFVLDQRKKFNHKAAPTLSNLCEGQDRNVPLHEIGITYGPRPLNVSSPIYKYAAKTAKQDERE
ncbi:hypothetical protein J4732_21235 [Serratia marcescens]|uniref:Uncharacterized protein n=1 Tax=Serratia marcescens TaxID=615 RepID=A0A939NQI5_SERMA|nr:hypothetical protein [Serratia marcescens]